jgi:hypothetical protein
MEEVYFISIFFSAIKFQCVGRYVARCFVRHTVLRFGPSVIDNWTRGPLISVHFCNLDPTSSRISCVFPSWSRSHSLQQRPLLARPPAGIRIRDRMPLQPIAKIARARRPRAAWVRRSKDTSLLGEGMVRGGRAGRCLGQTSRWGREILICSWAAAAMMIVDVSNSFTETVWQKLRGDIVSCCSDSFSKFLLIATSWE